MERSHIIKLITILMLFPFSGNAQFQTCEPYFNQNALDFEDTFNLKPLSFPIAFTSDTNYSAVVDKGIKKNGNQSVRITGTNFDSKSFANLSVRIPIPIKRGSKLEVSLWVKADSIHGENSGTMLRLTGIGLSKNNRPDLLEFGKEVIKNTADWKEISLECTVDKPLLGITISGLMQGKGIAWFDNFQLKIDDQILEKNLHFSSQKKSEFIKDSLEPFLYTMDQNMTKIGNKKDIKGVLGKAKIIGLGESTHGTKEIFEAKKRLIQYLIEEQDVTEIAIEAYYGNSLVLNSYIIEGKGDPVELIAGLGFWPYYTQEFLDLIQWLRNYNLKHNNKVRITGIDPQSCEESIKYLRNKFPDNSEYQSLLEKIDSLSPINLDNKAVTLTDSLKTLTSKMTSDKMAIKNSEIISQFQLLNLYSGIEYSKVRDSLMMENIKSRVVELPDNEKLVVWAHDLHLQRVEDYLGNYISKFINDSYINIAFILGSGKYTAVDSNTNKLESYHTLRDQPCHSLEMLLSDFTYQDILLFNSAQAKNNDYLKKQFYSKILYKRDIGALATDDQFHVISHDVQNLFDLYMYFPKSTPSTLLKN
ncbi:erythromycin esterase family protein [Christiangramia sp. LLG6405-1]|uniref:erythromycin esterase family protein n=1 Tax=Christiangramia sp. LLG6405-1 TaxID=3160832 RepID=UPI003868DBC3